MKRKRFWMLKPVYILLIALSVILTGILYFENRVVFFVAAPCVLISIGYSIYRMFYIQKEIYEIIKHTGESITNSHETSLIEFPISCMIV
ncbi:MAG: hypothetical protein RSA79_01130, partial [Oscillospiraceae bacterium]